MSESEKKNNSQIIRDLYLESGMSYSQLSKATGIKYNTLTSWLIGRRNPPDYAVELLRKKIVKVAKNHKKQLEKAEKRGSNEDNE